MAAEINFYAGENFDIDNLAGSGLGFYGSAGFGTSIPVGEFNGRTFITDSTGTSQGPETDNCKWQSSSGVIIGQTGSGILLTALPNYLSTLNIAFSNDTAVKVQNTLLYISDRTNKNNNPSGVNCYVAEIIHPGTSQTISGSGDSLWINAKGSGTTVSLADGPGQSGLSPNGPNTTDTRHDWYIAMSATPTTVGAKEFMLTITTEFL